LLDRRQFVHFALGGSAALLASAQTDAPARADYSLDIAPYSLELSPHSVIETVAYNAQVPGPLIRLQEGKPVTIDVTNRTKTPEVVHWHGLFLPSEVDGAMEEGTPAIPPGGKARYTFTPQPAGFRWYHTHVFAGHDLRKGQYTGLHGCLFIEPRENPGRYDAEVFLALHDWKGHLLASDDGSMNPSYDVSTINGRVLGFSEPLQFKANQRVLFHILNSSPTEVHWIAFPGHEFEVIALDGNAVPAPQKAPMLRLAPAERVCAIVEMNNPGVWVLGEVRKHVQAAGMGIVVEYAGQSGKAQWQQPEKLDWDYTRFGNSDAAAPQDRGAMEIPLVFKSKFAGHGDMDHWTINGKSFPHTDTIVLQRGQRYRLLFKNESVDDHPVHLHRHVFELCRLPGGRAGRGILKDTILVDANTETDVEFTAGDPGLTLFHCHQQNHMDLGFMMLFRYA
jgi:FtsP/CotA-like multicopper oxidase with cupredoxin domain